MSEDNQESSQSEKTKQELFNKNPDRFEDLKNCLLVVKRDPETKKLFIMNQIENDEETFIVEGRIKQLMDANRVHRLMKNQQTKKIMTPQEMNNGRRGFLNRLKR